MADQTTSMMYTSYALRTREKSQIMMEYNLLCVNLQLIINIGGYCNQKTMSSLLTSSFSLLWAKIHWPPALSPSFLAPRWHGRRTQPKGSGCDDGATHRWQEVAAWFSVGVSGVYSVFVLFMIHHTYLVHPHLPESQKNRSLETRSFLCWFFWPRPSFDRVSARAISKISLDSPPLPLLVCLVVYVAPAGFCLHFTKTPQAHAQGIVGNNLRWKISRKNHGWDVKN